MNDDNLDIESIQVIRMLIELLIPQNDLLTTDIMEVRNLLDTYLVNHKERYS